MGKKGRTTLRMEILQTLFSGRNDMGKKGIDRHVFLENMRLTITYCGAKIMGIF